MLPKFEVGWIRIGCVDILLGPCCRGGGKGGKRPRFPPSNNKGPGEEMPFLRGGNWELGIDRKCPFVDSCAGC
jgi:hypothetical protein